MPLHVAYQNQFKSISVRGYWLPECNPFCHPDESQDPVYCCLDSRVLGDDKLLDVLSQSEKLTLSAISSPAMRHQKTWSFILTRMVLGEVLQQDPKSIKINRVGKPRLEPQKIVPTCHPRERGDPDITKDSLDPDFRQDDKLFTSQMLHFNVSHSANLWIIAWSFEHEVGIDVQKIDTSINYQAIMRQFFTKSEQSQVNTISDFFDVWTQKEAVLKLNGLGFARMPKISTNSVEFIPLDISPRFKAHIAL